MPRQGLDRAAVLAAAIELADETGWPALTLRALAQRLHVQSPSLYNHVEGLEDVRRELSLEGKRQLRDAFAHATAGRARDDAVRSLAFAYRRFAKAHPGLYASTLEPAPRGNGDAQRATREVVDVVIAALSGYGLRNSDALHASRALRAALHGFITLELGGGFGVPAELESSFERLVDMLIVGLRSLTR